MLGGDLTSPYQFQRVAEAMLELDLPDDALRWALDGIERTSGWQVDKLYDLAAGLLAGRGDVIGALRLRREQHDRMPSAKIGRATSELQSLMRISYAVFCLKKKNRNIQLTI